MIYSDRHCLTLNCAMRVWHLLYLVPPPCKKKLKIRLLRALVMSLEFLTVVTVRLRSFGSGCRFTVWCLRLSSV